jgi:preprotein translocase subunit SecG
MVVFPVLAVGIFWKFVSALFILVSILLILVILVQKGRGGGLSGAFGGGAAGGLLGSKTGDFLTWVTIGLVGVFLLLAVLLAKFYRPEISVADRGAAVPQRQNAPAQTPPATPETGAPVPSGEANAPAATAPTAAPTTPTPATGANAPVTRPVPTTPAAAPDSNKPAAR